eukprot:12664376-Prorocentrum_lima.AAC.1
MKHTSHNPKPKFVQAIGCTDQDVLRSARSTMFIRTSTNTSFPSCNNASGKEQNAPLTMRSRCME